MTNVNNVLVQTSGMSDSCQDVNKFKQLYVRSSSLAGIFHLTFTVGYELFKKGDIYTAANGLKNI
jgi:hypothetical protein